MCGFDGSKRLGDQWGSVISHRGLGSCRTTTVEPSAPALTLESSWDCCGDTPAGDDFGMPVAEKPCDFFMLTSGADLIVVVVEVVAHPDQEVIST
jgi:hypothetical protein